MGSNATKFTVYEVHIALYPTDASDQNFGPPAYLGCCFERADISRSYDVRQRPFLGTAFQQNYNQDEQHSIELSNALQVSIESEVKSLDRFGRYTLVVVWHDEEKNVWLKRTYYGVTDVGEQVGGDVVIGMSMSFRAERVVQIPGRDSWPDLLPASQFGVVFFVLGASRTPLYGYGTSFFELPSFDAGLGEIVPTSGTLSFYVEGALAMQAKPDGLHIGEIVATGGSYLDTALPKLEFCINGVRVATLAKDGTLAAPNITEEDVAPADALDIELRLPPLNTWSASLRLGVTTALEFLETL